MLKTLPLILTFLAGTASIAFGQTPSPTPTPVPKANQRPEPKIETLSEPFDTADVKTMAAQCVKLETEAGDIEIEMYPESAPETVRSFLNLAATKAFDSTTFSRVVPGFVIQGGNIWTREGGVSTSMAQRARRRLPDEPNKILHERGVVSMARGDEPNTATTNFFILVGPGAHLDGSFAAFGRVTKGMDVADAINKGQVEGEKPVKPVRIRKAAVGVCIAK